jgi:UDP-2,3-diacylglucosamine hydrolase
MKLALFSSTKSRDSQEEPEYFLGKDKEWLLIYANYKLKQQSDIDCFVFGHRHLPLDVLLENKLSRYINLGDWINYCTYLEFDGVHLQLKAYGQPAFDYSSIKH